jgi:hypothetical protein
MVVVLSKIKLGTFPAFSVAVEGTSEYDAIIFHEPAAIDYAAHLAIKLGMPGQITKVGF